MTAPGLRHPANGGDYTEVLRARHDGCQWNPDEQRGSLTSDAHWRNTRAVAIVGGSIKYRVCANCVQTEKWRDHKQVPIR